jgi:heme exporter protein B
MNRMIRKELHNLRLQGGILLASLAFFTLALFCVSLTIGPEGKILRRSAPALLWILAILTTLFSTPHLIKNEAEAGLLDEVILHPSPSSFYLLSKMGAEFLLLGLPLIILGILFSPLFMLSQTEVLILSSTLLVGFPALSALGILGGLLTLNARGGSLLIPLLILPLTLPLLLFALSAQEMTRLGLDSFAPFCLLTSVSLFLVILSIGAGSRALRFAVEG